jgi:hypothetical protein
MATGGKLISDVFVVNVETQVSFSMSGTFNSAQAGRLEVALNNRDTGQTWNTCGVSLDSNGPGSVTGGFSLRLPPGNYAWSSALTSSIAGGMKVPHQQGLATVHNESDGSVPPGWIGRFGTSGANFPVFLFSGITGRKVSLRCDIRFTLPLNNYMNGLLVLEDLTDGSTIQAPTLLSKVKNANLIQFYRSAFSMLKIKSGHLYKASLNVQTDSPQPLSVILGFGDDT